MNDLERLTLSELLDRMADITVPDPVSYVPQTSGWYVLAGTLVLVLVVVGWRVWHWRRVNRYRRDALSELATIDARWQDQETSVTDLARLLRRTALAAFPRADVASLYGDDWLAFLDKAIGGTEFSRGLGRILTVAPYGTGDAPPVEQRHALVAQARRWVKSHDATVRP